MYHLETPELNFSLWSHPSTKHCPMVFWLVHMTLGPVVTCQTIMRLAFGRIFVGQPLQAVILNLFNLFSVSLTLDLRIPNSLEMFFILFSSLTSERLIYSD